MMHPILLLKKCVPSLWKPICLIRSFFTFLGTQHRHFLSHDSFCHQSTLSVYQYFLRLIFLESVSTLFVLHLLCLLVTIQSLYFPGLFSVIALVVYPVGWSTKRVKDLCGEYAEPFVIDSCSIGKWFTCTSNRPSRWVFESQPLQT